MMMIMICQELECSGEEFRIISFSRTPGDSQKLSIIMLKLCIIFYITGI